MREKKKMQRKPINKGKYIGFWLGLRINDKMINFCEKKNTTFSAFIRDAIIEKLDREGF